MRSTIVLGLAVCALAGCGGFNFPTELRGDLPRKGSVVPDATLKLTPLVAVPLEKLVFWGAYASAANLILDPMTPNWAVEEARFPNDHFHLSLYMKRFYAGGAGEARVVFHRRAKELMSALGYDTYQVIEYSEGLESSVLGSQRVAEGVIRLRKTEG